MSASNRNAIINDEEDCVTPSFHGVNCRHNGENPCFEIFCDECDYFLACFPEFQFPHYDPVSENEKALRRPEGGRDDR